MLGVTTAAPRGSPVPVGVIAAGTVAVVAGATVIASALALHQPGLAAWLSAPEWSVWVDSAALAAMVAGLAAALVGRGASAEPYAVACLAAVVPVWAQLPWVPAAAGSVALATQPLAIAGLGHAAVRGAAPRPAILTLYGLAAGACAVHVLGYDPFADPGCVRTCVPVAPVAGGLLSTRAAVTVSGALGAAAVAVGVTLVVRHGWQRPRVLPAVTTLALALLGVAVVARVAGWGDPTPAALRATTPMAVAAVGLALCAVAADMLRRRAAVDRLIASLSTDVAAPAGAAVGAVHVPVPDSSHWVGLDGARVEPDLPDAVVLSDGGGPVLRLLPASGVDRADVLAGMTATTLLVLRNTQLAALAKARLREIQASQRRIVAADDAERRRIERDLHDGAQQRLVGVALHLRVAMGAADAGASAHLVTAETHVRQALARLRRLAHGIFPTALAEEGLSAALDELAAAASVHTTVHVRLTAPVPTDAAMAAYTVVVSVLDALRESPAGGEVRVRVAHDDAGSTMRVQVDAPDGKTFDEALGEAADRVGAAGGRLTVDHSAVTTTVTAVIPCGS
jgi:signal transduction histidine kinase